MHLVCALLKKKKKTQKVLKIPENSILGVWGGILNFVFLGGRVGNFYVIFEEFGFWGCWVSSVGRVFLNNLRLCGEGIPLWASQPDESWFKFPEPLATHLVADRSTTRGE